MPARIDSHPHDDAAEKELRAAQRAIARAEAAASERNRLLAEMHAAGYPQRVLADIVNTTNRRVGVEPLTEGAIQKIIARNRDALSAT